MVMVPRHQLTQHPPPCPLVVQPGPIHLGVIATILQRARQGREVRRVLRPARTVESKQVNVSYLIEYYSCCIREEPRIL